MIISMLCYAINEEYVVASDNFNDIKLLLNRLHVRMDSFKAFAKRAFLCRFSFRGANTVDV